MIAAVRSSTARTAASTCANNHKVSNYRCRIKPQVRAVVAQWPERRADLGREQFGLFPGGEVAAPVHLVEVGEAGVGLLGPAARVRQISPGNVVKPTGTLTSGRGSPAARAAACVFSQYDRAAEAPVPVSQYSVMLSRM